MGSVATSKIPVINFTVQDLKAGTSSWCLVRTEVRQALEKYGCFEAICDDQLKQLHQEMLNTTKQLFDLPSEIKRKHPANDRYKDSYVPLFENIGLLDALDLAKLQSFTNLMWPQGNPSFCETVYSYITQASKMEQMVKRMIFESFGAEKYYDSYDVEQTTCKFRLIKYRPPKENETNIGLNEHTDSNFITVLSQSDVNGLEIQTKDGDEWISVTPSTGSLIVLVADGLMAWSNARLHSPLHRVIINKEKIRYSLAFHSFCKGIIQTPDELVDEEHPLLFKPFSHKGFDQYTLDTVELNSKSSIRDYCGVVRE